MSDKVRGREGLSGIGGVESGGESESLETDHSEVKGSESDEQPASTTAQESQQETAQTNPIGGSDTENAPTAQGLTEGDLLSRLNESGSKPALEGPSELAQIEELLQKANPDEN